MTFMGSNSDGLGFFGGGDYFNCLIHALVWFVESGKVHTYIHDFTIIFMIGSRWPYVSIYNT